MKKEDKIKTTEKEEKTEITEIQGVFKEKEVEETEI